MFFGLIGLSVPAGLWFAALAAANTLPGWGSGEVMESAGKAYPFHFSAADHGRLVDFSKPRITIRKKTSLWVPKPSKGDV